MHWRQKNFKDFLEKLTHFVVENLTDIFLVFRLYWYPISSKNRGSKVFMGECKNLVGRTLMGGDLVICWLMVGGPHQLAHNGKLSA